MSATKKLARFASSLEYNDLSEELISHLHLCLLDTIGCGLYGSRLPWGQKLIKTIKGMTRENTITGVNVFGQDEKFSPDHAALINGTLIHSFEFDDLHKTAVIHPGAEIIPVLLALAEHRSNNGEKITGEQFLTALAVGYEIGCQVGMVTGSEQLNKGFHPSATSGVFGAAAAGAKILNGTESEILHSLGIAGTQASGLMAAQYEAMAKRMNPGKSAQSGLMSALLAKEGFTGITNVIEAEYGGFASVFADRKLDESVFNDLGEKFETLNVGFKPYSSCGSNHTTVDSILEIIKEKNGPFRVEDIDSVEIESTSATKHHVGWDYKPSGTIGAQMNLAYTAAVSLLDGSCFVDQYSDERISASDVNEMIKKVRITANDEFDRLGREGRHQIRLRVKLSNGEIVTKERKHAKGSMFYPLTKEEVEEKFTGLITYLSNPQNAEEMLQNVMNVHKLQDIQQFLHQIQNFNKEVI